MSTRSSLSVLPLLAASALIPSLRADAVLTAAYWAEGSTDPSGNYQYNGPSATQGGSAVIGYIPTGSSQASPDRDIVNYFRTGNYLPGAARAYNGVLLGNLRGSTGLTATFSLSDTALPPGTSFLPPEIVGETYSGEVGSNAGLRLTFMGGYLSDGVTPNEWWSNPTSAQVTSMNNGQDVTLTVSFDPSQWSNYYGSMGNSAEAAGQFDAALSDVTRLGISFGSGYFFSDGFAFDTGGSAAIELDAIGTFSTPEPATFAILAGGLGAILLLRRRRALR